MVFGAKSHTYEFSQTLFPIIAHWGVRRGIDVKSSAVIDEEFPCFFLVHADHSESRGVNTTIQEYMVPAQG